MIINKEPSQYRADIDGLRAIAVWIVIAYHATFTGFSGGYVGVDVFFVISGFLITGLLYKEVDRTGHISLPAFYAKRFKRLFPALLFVIVSVLVVWAIFFVDVPAKTNELIKSIRYSIFGFANIFFKNHTGGYFDLSSDEMPLLHFWSLAVEEQFYFVWPFLILISSKLKWGFKTNKTRVIFVLSIVSVLSFVLTEYLLKHKQSTEAFYTMPARAWELGLGGLLYFLQPSFSKIKSIWLNFLSVLGLVGIIFCTYYYEVDFRFPGALALVPVLGTCFIILCGGQGKTTTDKLLSHPYMVKLGILSYGWYLWHWPLLAFERVYYLGAVPPMSWRIGAVLLSLFLSKISLDYIEKPVRHGDKINKLKPGVVIATCLGISALMVGLSQGLKVIEKMQMTPEFAQTIKFVDEKSPGKAGCDGSAESAVGKDCIFDYSTPESKGVPEVFVWGDSHSRAYFPLFVKLAEDKKTKVNLVSGSGMSPLIGVKELFFSTKNQTKNIGDQNNRIVENLRARVKAGIPVSVALVSRWTIVTGAKPISEGDRLTYIEESKDPKKSSEVMKEAFHKTLETLHSIGVQKIIIFLPTPEFKYEVLECRSSEKCDTSRDKFEKYRKYVVSVLKEAALPYNNVRFIDPADTFCTETNCPQLMKNDQGIQIPVVEDDDHVSVQSALFLGRKEKENLEWLASP